MTLVITFLAAVVATIVCYVQLPSNMYCTGTLALMYWGATLMWVVDGITCLIEGEAFIEIVDTAAMFDDALLGVLVVIVGLAAWAAYLLFRDPKGVIVKALGR